MTDIHQQKILILDFGSQYTQLIGRRIRELGVYCEIYPYDISDSEIKKIAPKGIILSGGSQTATIKQTARAPKTVFELGCPVLGICYGMQIMAAQLGGKVSAAKKREFGHAIVTLKRNSKLFHKLSNPTDVWMSHGDKVIKLPPKFAVIANSSNTSYAAIEHAAKNFYAVQFHPEVTHTKQGKHILKNFIYKICGCKKTWVPQEIIEDAITKSRTTLGHERVILGLSGGVDSSVAALLLHRAIGDNLICVFVNTGLLRLDDDKRLKQLFARHFNMKIIFVSAEQRFLKALKGINDPEQKRKIIGREFIEVFSQQASKLKDIKWLAQGTIYPDVIESAKTKFSKSEIIKSHHNVGGLPEKMHLKLVEPLRELFKDEVRVIGKNLGVPDEIINRHPFPGPGLGVRIIGAIKKPYLTALSQADHIFLEELRLANLYHKVDQAFAVFLPIKSVGVMGDQRKHDYVIALRAITTVDYMTANWANLPHKFLQRVANRIVNEVPGISRVVYDISGKPPATIEWE